MLKIIKAETADHYNQVRDLFVQYASNLEFDLEFNSLFYEIIKC